MRLVLRGWKARVHALLCWQREVWRWLSPTLGEPREDGGEDVAGVEVFGEFGVFFAGHGEDLAGECANGAGFAA